MAQVLRNGAVEKKTASVQLAPGLGCAARSEACIVPWGKEKGRKLVEASGLECGAGAGITKQAVNPMDAVFIGNLFHKCHQKYRHFSVCPICGGDEALCYDLTGKHKHPHGRGEDEGWPKLPGTDAETPPRAWGRHRQG